MGERGKHKDHYSEPRAGSRVHITLMFLRSPRGLMAMEAIAMGVFRSPHNLQSALVYLRDQCGYDFRCIAHEPSPEFMRHYRDGTVRRARGRPYLRYIVTCRYHWDGSVAEDFIADRLKRVIRCKEPPHSP